MIPWYVATELSANVDGFWSTYIYKEKNDPKIYFGPLWDYDIAYNNCSRTGDVTNASMVDKGFGSDLTKVWVKQLIKDPWFNNAVNDAWKKKINEGLEDYLCNYIDSMAEVLNSSQQLNYKRYSINTAVYNEIYLYSTYDEYINQLKNFIRSHARYLTTLFANRYGVTTSEGGDGGNNGGETEEPDVLHPFELNSSYYYRIYNKSTNMVLDVDDNKEIAMYSPVYDKNTQLWKIEKVGDYYRLINRAEEMAFNDPSYNISTQLNLAEVNDNDMRQLWQFVVVNENENYNIINAETKYAINNSGGSSAEGNNVISYTSDDRNSVSSNRQWRIVPEELIPDYIPDEVKEMLNTTIEEAETFLSSLNNWEIGDAPFCYDATKIETLHQMITDARDFESIVADDYILQNVILAEKLAEAQKINMPSTTQQYVLKHIASGYVLNLTTELTSLQEYDKYSSEQHFFIEQTGDDNKVSLRSVDGLYLSLGINNSWHMFGYENFTTIARGGFEFEPMDGFYRINTANGLLGTTYLDLQSKVYGNKQTTDYCDWILEEVEQSLAGEVELKQTELNALLEEAKEILKNIPKEWIGDEPMQLSIENVDALENVVTYIETALYTTLDEYTEAIALLNEAIENFSILNEPAQDKLYNIRHTSGLNLSCSNGATLEEIIDGDVEQCFTFRAVEGEKNCYNITNNGAYLSVYSLDNSMFMFSDTPDGENGRFVVTQVGENRFTLSSMVGFVGPKTADTGETVYPDVPAENAIWTIVEVEDKFETDIADYAYEQDIDYALRYDKERQVIGFVSFEIQEFADVDVCIYTVGGRLLYTFKGTQEQSLAELPTGTYIVKWNWAGRSHDVKFRKEL